MPDIHLQRAHQLGLPEARKLADNWVRQAEEKFDLACTREAGPEDDLIHFSRTGVSGTLKVAADQFELDAKLGFLLGTFKDRIEEEIGKNLDALLAGRTPDARDS